MDTRGIVDELLRQGAQDWVMAADVAWIARSIGGAVTDEEVREASVRAIRDAVGAGLVCIGDVTDGGFFAWDLRPLEAVEKVARDWQTLGRTPDVGDLCWFANTPEGDARAAISGEREH